MTYREAAENLDVLVLAIQDAPGKTIAQGNFHHLGGYVTALEDAGIITEVQGTNWCGYGEAAFKLAKWRAEVKA